MEDLLTFTSANWIRPLLRELRRIRGQRKTELQRIGDVFGDPLLLARYYIEPSLQHQNPADYDEDEQISDYITSPAFTVINEFLRRDILLGNGRNQLIVLADAGMGKTSLFMMIKLMHLMSFWPTGHACVLLKIGQDTQELIKSYENTSHTTLLLDALDEDSLSWGRVNERLTELLRDSQHFRRVLISCRNQFLPEFQDSPLGGGKVEVEEFICPRFFISLFNESHVKDYLRRRFPNRWYSNILR